MFSSPDDATSGMGKRPVILDVLGPDWATSVLPEGLRMVLHVNPSSMALKYTRVVERMQTMGGFVEQHWGDGLNEIDFDMATGGFVRLYSGLSNTTNPAYGGTRRDTIAYDKYLDLLALFHGNGAVYDTYGTIALQGILKITFDGGVYFGWFTNFHVAESAEKPYQFALTTNFQVHREEVAWKSTLLQAFVSPTYPSTQPPSSSTDATDAARAAAIKELSDRAVVAAASKAPPRPTTPVSDPYTAPPEPWSESETPLGDSGESSYYTDEGSENNGYVTVTDDVSAWEP